MSESVYLSIFTLSMWSDYLDFWEMDFYSLLCM